MASTRIRHRILYSLNSFIKDSRSVGILLLLCTIVSLFLSNTWWSEAYIQFWHLEIPFFHTLHLPHSLLHFINDGLMAVFFFMAGMEIKREMITGELASVKQALLPTVAAISGVAVPAIIFLLFNKGTEFAHGWAIPTATDIAFSLGIVALLGKRVPDSLRIFLTALAIIDDLCAIVIIALFYGSSIQWIWILGVVLFIVAILILNRLKRFNIAWLRMLFGVLLWYCMFHSGIHATVAGVIFAFLIPVNLLQSYEHKLHTFVNFFVIPIFAMANTAIFLNIQFSAFIASTLSWGVILGLVLGKPIGVFASSYFMIKRKWASMPAGATRQQLIGISILAGIGFTMSIFVSSLAFTSVAAQEIAKISIIIASFLAIIVGYLWLLKHAKK